MLNATLLLSGAALAASLVFGGGTRHGTLSDVVPELLALPLPFGDNRCDLARWRILMANQLMRSQLRHSMLTAAAP